MSLLPFVQITTQRLFVFLRPVDPTPPLACLWYTKVCEILHNPCHIARHDFGSLGPPPRRLGRHSSRGLLNLDLLVQHPRKPLRMVPPPPILATSQIKRLWFFHLLLLSLNGFLQTLVLELYDSVVSVVLFELLLDFLQFFVRPLLILAIGIDFRTETGESLGGEGLAIEGSVLNLGCEGFSGNLL